MRDYISIGATPCEEDCEPLGPNYNHGRAMAEHKEFIRLIREELGDEPPGARLAVKHFPHDFGTYSEVVCVYDADDATATDYAFRCESDAPAEWDDEARKNLGLVAKG